jgi:hypothetical protein
MGLEGKSANAIEAQGVITKLQSQGFTREQLVGCVEHEVKRREREYPRDTQLGKMNYKTARNEIALMKAVLEVVRTMPEIPAAQTKLKL